MVINSLLFPPSKDVPPPPPLPKYNIEEEASKWNFSRLRFNLPVTRDKPWSPVGTQPASSDDPDWRGVIRNKVNELPMPEPYKYGRAIQNHYFWFDTPDYADPFKKLWYSTKVFSKAGVIVGCSCAIIVNMNTVESGKWAFNRFFLPIVTGGLVASACVITLANLRGKKDDIYNYIPAGILGGAIAGRRSWQIGFASMLLGGIMGAVVKYNAEINGQLYPLINHRLTAWGISGQSANNGPFTGDLRFGYRGNHGEDTGRDVRRVW